ncbi:hypothetical protein M378DRAFT_32415, partial [Amanita muscaria Koide BX008]
STSRGRVEDTYEAQNDQRSDELHTKIRTTWCKQSLPVIAHSSERRPLDFRLHLTFTTNGFSLFATTLNQTSRRATQAFGIGTGSVKPWQIAMLI